MKKLTSGMYGKEFAFRDKMGFGIPLKQYFSDGDFKQYLQDVVLPGISQRGILNPDIIKKWLTALPAIGFFEMEALWIAIAFEIWAKTYLDLKNENWNSSYEGLIQ